ncbi:MAG: DUF11 domain-containing protein [Candidatus Eisenbacteria bacterium]|uniref:DUF11 domain-containing protein n=1 Tax=Eiseniibacteriota bacterium TaxID=2212470 RepID=A0A7Y2E6J4_UNCEI|nr:DUF11 domain-containing protein [Candidatus Eisenbacteria bacterium]
MKNLLISVLVSGLFVAALPSVGAAAVKLKTMAEKEVIVINDEGEETVTRVAADQIVPGDVIIYTIFYENVGKQPAETVRIVDPIPEEMTYKTGSAESPDVAVLFSVDGGKTMGLMEELRVVEEDGVVRPALASDFTHVMWTLTKPLAPGDGGEVSFRAQLK